MNRDKLRQSLIAHEGLRLKAYLDTVGKVTIGYGRNLTDIGITQDEADAMLEHDIDMAVLALVNALPWVQDVDDVRFNVLAEMAFNLGCAGLRGFTQFLASVKSGDYVSASRHMLASKWAAQVGNRAVRLAKRMESGAWM